ncbi:MAG: hypothetical protein JNM84_00575 [Planctomycetes bacterium]|nr:hypothetical protein [Planctomycetota bacterium]
MLRSLSSLRFSPSRRLVGAVLGVLASTVGASAQSIYALEDQAQLVHHIRFDARLLRFERDPSQARSVGNLDWEAPRLRGSLGASSDGRWIFVGRENGLVVLSRAADGSLEPVAGSPLGGIGRVLGVASRTRLGRTAIFATEQIFGVVRTFDADARTGVVAMREGWVPAGTPGGATCLALSRRLLCVLNTVDRAIYVFDIDPFNATLTAWPLNPFPLPVWTSAPTQLIVDAQETSVLVNDASSSRCGVLDIDVRARELRYPREVPTLHAAPAQLVDFRRNGRTLFVAGSAGLQLFDGELRSNGAAPLPFAALEDLALDPRERGLFVASARSLSYVPLDRRSSMPSPDLGRMLRDAFTTQAMALVVVR